MDPALKYTKPFYKERGEAKLGGKTKRPPSPTKSTFEPPMTKKARGTTEESAEEDIPPNPPPPGSPPAFEWEDPVGSAEQDIMEDFQDLDLDVSNMI